MFSTLNINQMSFQFIMFVFIIYIYYYNTEVGTIQAIFFHDIKSITYAYLFYHSLFKWFQLFF